jgi:dihydroneopterin aldolase
MNQRRVFIRNWKVKVFTGVHAYEQGKKRDLRLNISLYQDDAPASAITDVISYSTQRKRMAEVINARHYLLLEMLGEALISAAFEDPRVRRVTIEIEKMKLYKDAESCGVAFDRTR